MRKSVESHNPLPTLLRRPNSYRYLESLKVLSLIVLEEVERPHGGDDLDEDLVRLRNGDRELDKWDSVVDLSRFQVRNHLELFEVGLLSLGRWSKGQRTEPGGRRDARSRATK